MSAAHEDVDDRALLADQRRVTLMTEQRDDVTAAMHDVQDQHHVTRHNAVDDDVIVGRKTSQAGAQIAVAATAR